MFKKLLITSLIALSASSAFAKQTDFTTALQEVDFLKFSQEESSLNIKIMEAAMPNFSDKTAAVIANLSPNEFATAKKLAKKYPAYQLVVETYSLLNYQGYKPQFIKKMKGLCPKITEACHFANME